MDVKETKCGSQGVAEWHMFFWLRALSTVKLLSTQ